MTPNIRDATVDDIPAITEIYNEDVLTTTVSWNAATVDEDDRRAWFAGRATAGLPVLVAVDELGAVLGYATYADFRTFSGYRHTVEHSVYVRGEARGRGLGKALTLALIDRARRAGKHVMVAAIDADNSASISLHERLGFTHAGRLDQVGTKFGRWLDVIFLQLILDAGGPGDAGRS
ncbi:phosphinothricin acetyltransferase [Pseudoclavibacter sp. JAI123]|uniref:GNAT family N-acetyltransferase n=1 Tax=Pseudoclavibacter sp. JAI123 TaxID=2723065 RepID=UPI0015CEC37B|nr:GNAT family N-acetyltransferase [Pseudoclavibacter sp. JAI123]NYF12588.1 phosphinothricin acetyltransferase [Pseudoclavibacter sp. JAI123]